MTDSLTLAYDQCLIHIQSQFNLRQELQTRGTAIFGRCLVPASILIGLGNYLLPTHLHWAMSCFSTSALLMIAASIAVWPVQPDALPGTLPSDLWEHVINPEMTRAALLSFMLQSFQLRIERDHAAYNTKIRRLRWSYNFQAAAVLSGILLSLLSN